MVDIFCLKFAEPNNESPLNSYAASLWDNQTGICLFVNIASLHHCNCINSLKWKYIWMIFAFLSKVLCLEKAALSYICFMHFNLCILSKLLNAHGKQTLLNTVLLAEMTA